MKRTWTYPLTGALLGFLAVTASHWVFEPPGIPMPPVSETMAVEHAQHVAAFHAIQLLVTLAFAGLGFALGRALETISSQNEQLLLLSRQDGLTGLGNRRALSQALEGLDHDGHRDRPVSGLMLDLDHFKAINDAHGHGFGDEVLRGFAEVVRGAIRRGDVAVRVGGEEFFCLLPDCGPEEARAVAERIRRETEGREFLHQGQRVTVTVSCGAVTSLRADVGSATLLERADALLYRAKSEGRNRVCQPSRSQELAALGSNVIPLRSARPH